MGNVGLEIVQRLAGRGEVFGRYKLKGEVARGSQGVVLRVWDEDLQRNIAMKVILGKGEAEPTGETPEVGSHTLARFLDEARVTGQLDHPGIVPVHELGLDSERRVYFTMKLVEGETLEAIFDKEHRSEDGWTLTRALGVMLKVCEAVAYAHLKGVIHRDLKPANIMVGRFGEVYVMDWGLARVMGEEDREDIGIEPIAGATEVRSERRERASETPDSPLVTMQGDVVGTPAYMSPEQASGDVDSVGPLSDVYSAGAMLYHLLAGHTPYVPPGAELDNLAVWSQVREGPPAALTKVASDTPPEVEAICEKAMARPIEDRYRSVEELALDLRAYLEQRVVKAHAKGPVAELRKWVARNRAAAALVLLLFVGVILGVYLVPVVRAGRLESLRNEEADALSMLDSPRRLQDADQELRDRERLVRSLGQIGERILAGEGTLEDQRRYVTAMCDVQVVGRAFQTIGKARVKVVLDARALLRSQLGILAHCDVYLDGKPQPLLDGNTPMGLIIPELGMGGTLSLDLPFDQPGLHTVGGRLRIQLVRLPDLNAVAPPPGSLAEEFEREGRTLSVEDPGEEIPHGEIFLQVKERSFVFMNDLPEGYPVEIADPFIQDQFARHAVARWESTGSEHTRAIRMTLPVPSVWLPITVELIGPTGPIPDRVNSMDVDAQAGGGRLVTQYAGVASYSVSGLGSPSFPIRMLLGPDIVKVFISGTHGPVKFTAEEGGHVYARYLHHEVQTLDFLLNIPAAGIPETGGLEVSIEPAPELLLDQWEVERFAPVSWRATVQHE